MRGVRSPRWQRAAAITAASTFLFTLAAAALSQTPSRVPKPPMFVFQYESSAFDSVGNFDRRAVTKFGSMGMVDLYPAIYRRTATGWTQAFTHGSQMTLDDLRLSYRDFLRSTVSPVVWISALGHGNASGTYGALATGKGNMPIDGFLRMVNEETLAAGKYANVWVSACGSSCSKAFNELGMKTERGGVASVFRGGAEGFTEFTPIAADFLESAYDQFGTFDANKDGILDRRDLGRARGALDPRVTIDAEAGDLPLLWKEGAQFPEWITRLGQTTPTPPQTPEEQPLEPPTKTVAHCTEHPLTTGRVEKHKTVGADSPFHRPPGPHDLYYLFGEPIWKAIEDIRTEILEEVQQVKPDTRAVIFRGEPGFNTENCPELLPQHNIVPPGTTPPQLPFTPPVPPPNPDLGTPPGGGDGGGLGTLAQLLPGLLSSLFQQRQPAPTPVPQPTLPPDASSCPQEYAPVCADEDGKAPFVGVTMYNRCVAERAGAVVLSEGACAEEAVTPPPADSASATEPPQNFFSTVLDTLNAFMPLALLQKTIEAVSLLVSQAYRSALP